MEKTTILECSHTLNAGAFMKKKNPIRTVFYFFITILVLMITTSAVQPFHQCGGEQWTGQRNCVAGYYCHKVNLYYSQCIPSSTVDVIRHCLFREGLEIGKMSVDNMAFDCVFWDPYALLYTSEGKLADCVPDDGNSECQKIVCHTEYAGCSIDDDW
ncbi:hypothetical protein [Pedobacter hiemivivus]|uniref:CBM1 domain-containing protein n=1 Tax=Pedobacter hiemivivus TaxID=2530454 RepID=A0A4R0N8G4_9SPHI|nr:hypothetical protein [Pedobacter hiemivivus]TCC96285.1 hypothetical protein EZ444_12685 [Pedobacter hiemivivus]